MEKLLREWTILEATVRKSLKKLEQVKKEIAQQATFKKGSNTTEMQTNGATVVVSKTYKLKFEQEDLFSIAPHFIEFEDVFQKEYKLKSKAVLEQACATNPHFARAIDYASEITETTPNVTFKLNGGS